MANYCTDQPLTEWEGDIPSLILEMKRRTGVRTDTELAEFLGISQSTISTWRRRKTVPAQALLSLEIATLERQKNQIQQPIVVIALAMRVAEFIYQRQRHRGSSQGRWLAYSAVALSLKNIMEGIEANLTKHEEETGRWSMDLGAELIDDESYLAQLADWVEARSAFDIEGKAEWRDTPKND